MAALVAELSWRLAHPCDTPMANLLVSVVNKCGVPIEKIGNSNGAVDI